MQPTAISRGAVDSGVLHCMLCLQLYWDKDNLLLTHSWTATHSKRTIRLWAVLRNPIISASFFVISETWKPHRKPTVGSRGQEVSRPVSIDTSMAARAFSWEGSCCCHIFTDIRAGEALKPVSARKREFQNLQMTGRTSAGKSKSH